MIWTNKRDQRWQIYFFCALLLIQITFLKAADNSSDIQSLLNEFAESENGSKLLNTDLDDIFNTSIENNTSDELVIKKNLYIFPVNAPNLVISQKHEIHAIPILNNTNSTEDEPVTELHDIHEISLSKLLAVNDSQTGNVENGSTLKLNSNLQPPKNLEIVSAYKPGSGLITKEIPLPKTVDKSITLPQNSIADLLSTLNESSKESDSQMTETPEVAKRDAKPSELTQSDFPSTLSHETVNPDISSSKPTGSMLRATGSKLQIVEDHEDMDVAEDIVFRPLFRYRQETRLRPENFDDAPYRSSGSRRRDRYRYSGYDNYYYPNYRYRSRSRSDDYGGDYN